MALEKIKKNMLDKETAEKLESIILTSPDGTDWTIQVNDDGTIKANKKAE